MNKPHNSAHAVSRRTVMKGSLMAAALSGTGTLFGPWRHNRVWAQGAKPI
jgi:branched-chain amino acid transport system substrate-binding protein